MRAVRTTWFITARSATTGALRLVLRLLGLASFLALDGLHHRRRAGVGLLLDHREVAQHGVVEAEGVLELAHHVLVGLDVDAQVVRLGELVDLVGQLAAAPVLDTMHLAAAGGDHALVTLQHGRNLLALVRVDQQHDFIMTHGLSLRMGRGARLRARRRWQPPPASDGVRQGKAKDYTAGGTDGRSRAPPPDSSRAIRPANAQVMPTYASTPPCAAIQKLKGQPNTWNCRSRAK